MNRLRGVVVGLMVGALGALCARGAGAQVVSSPGFAMTQQASALVVPQQRVFPLDGSSASAVRLKAVQAVVTVIEQVATTSLKVQLENPTDVMLQAEILLPVPDGAVVRGFDFEGESSQPTARLLPKDEARELYEGLVRRIIDPALLEFAGYELIRSSVFPVPAHGTQAVSLVWEQVLPAHGARIDYELPRSRLATLLPVPWQIAVRLQSQHGITTTWSPSHELATRRLGPGEMFLELAPAASQQSGAFVLSWLRGERGLQTSFLAFPNAAPDASTPAASGASPDAAQVGGYVVMLTGVPEALPPDALPREVSLVLDRSGSMRGEKFDQALEAARQILEGLKPGEAFNLFDYSDHVSSFAPRPVLKDAGTLAQAREYLALLSVDGGTNLHDALAAVVKQDTIDGFLPVVLFLTDGLPTVGTIDEKRIRDDTRTANTHGRRLFTFGVGDDVNAPLLDALAADSRALASFVRPKEDVEVKVGEVYRRLFGPVLVEPELEICDAQGRPTSLRIREQEPHVLNDLYAGDQLLVAARYHGTEPVLFRLKGRSASGETSSEMLFDPATADRKLDFVPRLWASRRIGTLVDEVRQAGSTSASSASADGAPANGALAAGEPALAEIVQEIVALSTQFGILTEYTAFMATEGSQLFDPSVLRKRTRLLLASRAQNVRTGRGAVSQAVNIKRMRGGAKVDRLNAYLDSNLKDIQVSSITYAGDLAFFHAGDRWIDARIVALMQAAHETAAAAAVPTDASKTPADASATPAGTSAPSLDASAKPLDASAKIDPLKAKAVVVDFGSPEYIQLSRRLTKLGRAGLLALPGMIVTLVDDQRVIIRPPQAAPAPAPAPPASGSSGGGH